MTAETPTFTVNRTQDEISARFDDAEDWLGFAREVLIDHLDYGHAKEYLKDDVTAEQWEAARNADLDAEIRRYLEFAVQKIRNQRGISAERSTIKLREMAWLAGRDDIVKAMDDAEYPNYGEPKVRAFAEGMGLDWPDK